MGHTEARAEQEQKQARREQKIGSIVDYQLIGHLSRHGVDVRGLSFKFGEGDCLMTVRGTVEGVAQVCFVGGETMGGVYLKAAQAAKSAKLVWRLDRYST